MKSVWKDLLQLAIIGEMGYLAHKAFASSDLLTSSGDIDLVQH